MCKTDEECSPYSSNRACVTVEVFNHASGSGGRCECNSWYGWARGNKDDNDCKELSFQSYFLMVVSGLIILLSFIGIVIGLMDLASLANEKRLSRNAAAYSVVFALIALTFTIVWNAFVILNVLSRSNPPLLENLDGTGTFGRYEIITLLFAPASAVTATFSLLQVSLMWIEVANSTVKMNAKVVKNLEKFRYVLIVFELLLMCGLFAIFITGVLKNNFSIFAPALGYLTLPFVIFVFVTYLVGAFKLQRVLVHTSTTNTIPVTEPIQKRKRTSLIALNFIRKDSRADSDASQLISTMPPPLLANNNNNNNNNNNTEAQRITNQRDIKSKERVQLIRKTSRQIAITLVLFIASFTTYSILETIYAWKAFHYRVINVLVVIYEITPITICFSQLIIIKYIHYACKANGAEKAAEAIRAGIVRIGKRGSLIGLSNSKLDIPAVSDEISKPGFDTIQIQTPIAVLDESPLSTIPSFNLETANQAPLSVDEKI